MEGNIRVPQSLGGCPYIKTFKYSTVCGSQITGMHQSPQRASKTARLTLSFRFSGSGRGKYVLLVVVKGPQHP